MRHVPDILGFEASPLEKLAAPTDPIGPALVRSAQL
jgi:hypothetical protein